MTLSELEMNSLTESFHRIAEAIRTRRWSDLVAEGTLDAAMVDACDTEWTIFGADLKPLSKSHIRRTVEEDADLPLPNEEWLGVWLRMAENDSDRAYDLVAVIDVRRSHRGLECRLYDLRVP